MKISTARIHTIIVYIIIVGSVFVDLLNGYLNYYKNIPIPVGVAFRTLITAFTFYYVISLKRVAIYQSYVGLVFILWICCLLYWVGGAKNIELGLEISSFAKVIFPLFLVCYYYYVIQKGYVSLDTILKFAVTNGFVAGLFILFSFVSGIGFNTYAVKATNKSYGFGNSSFFKAQNDISLELLMSLCIAMYYFFKRRKFIDIVRAVVIAMGALLIGTRAGLLGGLLIIISFTFYNTFFVKIISRFEIIKRFVVFFLVIVIASVAAVLILQKIAESPFMLSKYSVAGLASTRATLTDAAETYIDKTQQNAMPFLFGEGNMIYTSSLFNNLGTGRGNSADEKTAERDWIDLRGGYGTVFAIGIYLLPFLTFFTALKYFLSDIRDIFRFSMLLAITLFIFHSLFAGHGLKNPAPETLLAILYLYTINSKLITQHKEINA